MLEMEENGKFITRLYQGDKFTANVVILPQTDHLPFNCGQDLRVSSFSPASDRCYPLVVLRTIATEGVLFKLQPAELSHPAESRELEMMHSLCLKEFKTAVMSLDVGTELHLVAMTSSREQWPCFWGFHTISGLYSSCLTMLNLRCLALVFDLDETLIVANTMRSFEDRIEALGSKIRAETDAQKLSGMSSELKRYIQDRTLLKQFVDDDHVWDNAAEKYVDAQREVVPPITEGALPLMRPVVRLQERNMVFTRINPNVRDTSVLVRLRPAWEDLRSYLTAKGRKRFEVFICTMSEKEYALEMWRLLDPEAQLISVRELIERVVCVKSGSKKSLTNVFSYGHCHPKMAMVIDDRLKVWEDRDQSHVHVVPPFAPYYAPQAETNSPLPILCVARNVACNVRGGFFRDFDEGLLKKMAEVDFTADVSTLPQPPVISNYLAEEEAPPYELANGNKEFPDGMTDAEVEKRLASVEGGGSGAIQFPNVPLESEGWKSTLQPPVQQVLPIQFPSPALLRPQPPYSETQHEDKQDFMRFSKDLTMLRPITSAPSHFFEPALQSSPVREEGEVPESELDPDTRRRLLILQHGQDTEHPRNPQENSMDSSFSLKGQLHLSIPSAAPAGGWLGAEEEMSPRQLSRSTSGIILEPESPSFGKQRSHGPSFFGGPDLVSIDGNSRDMRRNLPEEVYIGEERQRSDSIFLDHPYPENDGSTLLNTSNSRDFQVRSNSSANNTSPVTVLQEIAQKCKTRLEFRSLLNTSTTELQFSVEVLFGGEKVGEGIGRTKKEAQHKAADNSLRFMASQFILHPTQAIDILGHGRLMNSYSNEEPAPRWNTRDPRFFAGLAPSSADEDTPIASTSGQSKFLDFRHVQELNRAYSSVAALKDHCTMEGITVVFKDPSQGAPSSEVQSQGFSCQVEVAGQVMGKGSGRSWDEAKQQAAEEALRRLKSTAPPRGCQKRMNSPRSPPLQSNKRVRSGELTRGLQRLPPSPRKLSPRRYTKNGSSAP